MRDALSEGPLIYDLSMEDLTTALAAWGEPAYRARQIWHSLYRQLRSSPEEMSDLSIALRGRLAQSFRFSSLTALDSLRSKDGETEKLLLGLASGHQIETVLMRYERRRTACISTQAGCAMGCPFCATGQMGLQRNLSSGEIVEQVLLLARRLSQEEEHLTNVVLMGMGEPFHNYEASLQAIARLNDPQGFGFGARRFTISTVGLVPMIERFTRERHQVNLAVSLHAATDELRDRLVPINRRYPLSRLIPACRTYVEHTRRRITFEWALIQGVNDGADQSQALAKLIAGMNCHVNLIPLNPTRGYEGQGATRARAEAFRDVLKRRGIPCTIRVRRGVDIQAGCGQLATEHSR